jgi:hypothetical protein
MSWLWWTEAAGRVALQRAARQRNQMPMAPPPPPQEMTRQWWSLKQFKHTINKIKQQCNRTATRTYIWALMHKMVINTSRAWTKQWITFLAAQVKVVLIGTTIIHERGSRSMHRQAVVVVVARVSNGSYDHHQQRPSSSTSSSSYY